MAETPTDRSTGRNAVPGDDAHRRLARARRCKRVIRSLQSVVTLALFLGVWFVAFGGDDGTAPIIPDTTTQFSLDLRVVDSSDHDIVYAVEQRARPYYRIFSFEPATGEIETVFTVPEDAIIYGITLSPDRDTLAIAYSADFEIEGSGIWTLDLSSGILDEVVAIEPNRYFVDPVWSSDNAMVATRVDRSAADEVLDIVEISLGDGQIALRARGGVAPAVDGDDLYFLQVDDSNARQAIGHLGVDGTVETIAVEDGQFDLDHLIAADGASYVAILDSDGGGLTIGEPADAHGNHDVRSTWWSIDLGTTPPEPSPTDLDPIIVYDAEAMPNGAIVYATLEGLSIGDGSRIDLIKSRAIRFVAA